ncbi:MULTISPECIES: LysR family transcriptional regulator [unclassified Bradyrhizobium]|uniref:LysR family transcriptional regulator n=1 Tax=unclassified Bradyrhizobium TaxID=2631580 RepID=UPI00102E4FAF|nr:MULTISPECIES: LysR family transcriptional regulator [unclassified Bradyrhizobium]MDI4231949.1 LysR family transcriptional regulator [Bradyrhizobium sp. Arg237L]TAI66442.1 LysR family transcriptional regulator [Bradyrhizobium sp. Leo170]
MKFSLRALRYVVETADAGSVTEAAKRLNVSQPSISAAVSQMEAELGIQIFVRHLAKGVTLSPAGQRLVNDARLLLNHARDFAQSAQSLGSTLHGEIVVGSFLTLATRFMPGLLAGFRVCQPGISVKLEEGDQQEIIDGLISGRTELALSYSFAVPDEIIGEKFCELPPYIVLSASHPLATRSSISLTEMRDEPFILLDLPHSRDYFSSLFTASGIEPRISFRTRSFELIRGLIGHGQGYSIHNAVPRTTIGYDGSRVAVVPITEKLPPTHVMALRLKRHALRPAVQTFADYAREAFAVGGQFAPGSIAPSGIDAA